MALQASGDMDPRDPVFGARSDIVTGTSDHPSFEGSESCNSAAAVNLAHPEPLVGRWDSLTSGGPLTTQVASAMSVSSTVSMRNMISTPKIASSIGRAVRRLSQDNHASLKRSVSMRAHVDPHLLKGVRMDVALENFGAHWCQSTADTSALQWGRAQTVTLLDDFISHDWKTKRWSKFFCLCFVLNSKPALVVSTMVGLAANVLESHYATQLQILHGVQPHRHIISGEEYDVERLAWCLLPCVLAYILIFSYWQRIRSLVLRRPRLAFVDKLCIHQTDHDLKTAGILSLAGFLRHSRRIVILWSPRYFTRLWCTYELASWLYLGRSLKRTMKFMSTEVSSAFIIVMGLSTVVWAMRTLFCCPQDAFYSYYLVVLLALFVAVSVCRGAAQDQHLLSEQLATFSIRDSCCFCCSNNHVDPVTGQAINCDRALVYRTLATWCMRNKTSIHSNIFVEGFEPIVEEILDPTSRTSFELVDMVSDETLDSFDAEIRTRFRNAVMRTAGGLPFSYADVLVTLAPFLMQAVQTSVASAAQLPTVAAVQLSAEEWVHYLAVLPCFGAWLGFGMSRAESVTKGWASRGRCRGSLLVLLWTALAGVLHAIMHSSLYVSMQYGGPLVQTGVSLVYVVLVIWLYRQKKFVPHPIPSQTSSMARSDSESLVEHNCSSADSIPTESAGTRGDGESSRSSGCPLVSSSEMEEQAPAHGAGSNAHPTEADEGGPRQVAHSLRNWDFDGAGLTEV